MKLIRSLTLAALLAVLPATGKASVSSGLAGVPYSGLAWFLIGFELGPWEDYLIRELTPEFDAIEAPPQPRMSWLAPMDSLILPSFAESLLKSDRSLTISVGHSRQRLVQMDGVAPAGDSGQAGSLFQRQLITPGVARQLGEGNVVSVSAVLATQHFGHSMLEMHEEDQRAVGTRGAGLHGYVPYEEVSHGTGMRVALRSQITPGFALDAALQSRIDMEPFSNYHGVYGLAAELDIPSRAQVGMELQATRRNYLTFGVSQVFYSEVAAFPSRALPARFLALLGDGGSPEFAWKDLTVYTLGWRWTHESDLEFRVDYSTRSQPTPSSRSLAQALDSELAKNSLLVGVSKGVGRNGRLQLNAAYAPPEYAFGGNVLGVVSDQLDQSLEVQAQMSWVF